MQLILAFLATLLLGRSKADQSQYQLTPPLPPTAFLGQGYSCQFRVTGLAFPAFRFEGLPSGLIGSSSGLVKGLPTGTGSFLITITYSSNSYQASKQTVLRVALSGDSPQNVKLINSLIPRFAITADHFFVCMVGVAIEIRLGVVMGIPPYFWAYLRLPSQLHGGNGTITGIFELEGYYSFGVSCADSAGHSTEAYFTLNVQPLAFFASYAPPDARPLAEVPVRDSFPSETWKQAVQAQQAAIASMQKAAEERDQRSKQLSIAREKAERSSTLLSAAKKQCESRQRLISQLKKKKETIRQLFSNVSIILAVKNQTRNEKQQKHSLQNITSNQASKEVALAQQTVEQLGVVLHSASSQFTFAQNSSTSISFLVNSAILKESYLKDQLINVESSLSQARQQYQSAIKAFDQANQQAQITKEQEKIAKSDRDSASSSFKTMSKNAEDRQSQLKKANQEISILKLNSSDAKKGLENAKYSLQLALNQLYVAQAAKEQADKAMLILTTQYLQPPPAATFQGCQQGAFPSIFGSGIVVSMDQGAIMLSSGQQLLFGNCTILQPVEVGNEIYFEGYLRKGCKHLLRVSKQE